MFISNIYNEFQDLKQLDMVVNEKDTCAWDIILPNAFSI